MKKLNKMLALCLALTMLLVCVPLTASATETTYGPENIQEIPGIDYNRITQKATGGGKSYPVELKMGDLTFTGELSGSHGLSYEELNKIINEVLKEKNLTADRIALVAKLAGRVETDAALYWGDQIIQGLLSFIPTPPGSPGGVNDYYAWIVHGEGKGVGSMAAESALSTAVTAAEIALNPSTGQYFSKIPFAATTGTDKVPLLGQLINTFKVGKEWLEGNKQLEKYLDLLEKNLADINGFYSECSRRANKLAEEKGETSDGYSIKFNNATATDTFSFWGISGLMSEWTLSGELKKGVTGAGDGVIGNYEGTLTLSMKALDMAETFDKNWVMNSNALPSGIMRVFKSGDTFTDTPQQTTKFERMISGEFNLYIAGASSGIYEPTVFGSFNGADIIDFSFNHKAESTQSAYTDGSNGYIYGANLTSSDVNTVYFEGYHTFPIIMGSAGTGPDTWVKNTGDLEMNIGTVWEPLDGEVSVEINFGR